MTERDAASDRAAAGGSGDAMLAFGDYELHIDTEELRRNGRRVRLAPQACRLLVALTAVPHVVVSREQLRRALWPDATHVDFERSLNSAMRKLRAALNDHADAPRYVQTQHGRGYRFIAPVRLVRTSHAGSVSKAAPAPAAADVGRVAVATLGLDGANRRRDLRALLLAAVVLLCAGVGTWAIASWTSAVDVVRLVVRLDDAVDAASPDSSAPAARLVAALHTHLGRLKSPGLAIVDRASQATHEMVVRGAGGPASSWLSVRLLDRRSGEQRWADVVDVVDGAAERAVLLAAGRIVTDRLLHANADARLVAATTSDRALAAYREGRAHMGERISALSRALESFDAAVQLDPEFAPAWAALARTRATRAMLDGRDAPELRRARLEAQRALATDRELADAHMALGQVRLALDNDPAAAEIDVRRAQAMGADTTGHPFWLVWVLMASGRPGEALRVLDDGLARAPSSAALHAWRGFALHALHRYEDEIAALQQAVAIDEQSWLAALHLGLGYSRRGQYDLALPALRRAVALSDAGGISLSWLGRIAADAGDLDTASDALRELRLAGSARGVAPALAASIEHHLAVQRHHRGPRTVSRVRS